MLKKITKIEVDSIHSIYLSSWSDTIEFQLDPYGGADHTEISIKLTEEQLRTLKRQVDDRIERMEKDALEKAREQVEAQLKEEGEI